MPRSAAPRPDAATYISGFTRSTLWKRRDCWIMRCRYSTVSPDCAMRVGYPSPPSDPKEPKKPMPSILPIEHRDHRLWHLTNSALRQAVLRGATRPFADNVVVNEFPKSGGSWFSQMLAETLEMPFPRHRLPMARSCIMQCHILNPWNMRNVVLVWRDGRDVAVSLYHHLLMGHEKMTGGRIAEFRGKAGIEDPADVTANLPRFIEAMMTDSVYPRFTWPDFVETWHNRSGTIATRYEDLLVRPGDELARIAVELGNPVTECARLNDIVERYSFRAQSGRHAGEEKQGSFMRKGIAGDWKTHFSAEAEEIFEYHAGDALRALGYES